MAADAYDPTAFPPLAVTVDLVLMSVEEGALRLLLGRRPEAPFEGVPALPGGFVREGESLDETARRILGGKAHLQGAWLEQLYSFGRPDRDPRMRVVTVAYYALLPAPALRNALKAAPELLLARIEAGPGEEIHVTSDEGDPLPLAFDHDEIVRTAILRLRGKLSYTPIAFSLLPELFTLRQLQDVHEAILARPLNKPAFRRKMLDSGWLAASGTRESGASYRPAELYRFNPAGTEPG